MAKTIYKEDQKGLMIQVTVSSPNTMTHKPFNNAKDAVQFLLKHCTEDERLELFGEYCRGCGTDRLPCYCQNDD
jgi:hypothetical protein